MVFDNICLAGITAGKCSGNSFVPQVIDMADRLLKKLEWGSSLDVILTVTQTPLFFLPSTSFYIQKEIGGEKPCMVFDMNLGATGMITAMQTGASLISQADCPGKALILLGDDPEQGGQMITAAVALEKQGGSRLLAGTRSFGMETAQGCYYLADGRDGEEAWTPCQDTPAFLPWLLCKTAAEGKTLGNVSVGARGAGLAEARAALDLSHALLEILE